MSALLTVMLKELRDLVRDRRTLYVALLMGPLLLPAIMIGLGGLVSKKVSSQLEKRLEVFRLDSVVHILRKRPRCLQDIYLIQRCCDDADDLTVVCNQGAA